MYGGLLLKKSCRFILLLIFCIYLITFLEKKNPTMFIYAEKSTPQRQNPTMYLL